MSSYILALDQGTTGSTALLIDQALTIKAKANQEFPQYYPKPGWVEHNLNEIWTATLNTIQTVLKESQVPASQIAAIGITNQRETTCLWDRKSGQPLFPAIVWQFVTNLKNKEKKNFFEKKQA